MPATDVLRLGMPCSDSAAGFYTGDYGDTTISGATTTVTATIPTLVDGTQPLVRQGWLMVEVRGRSGGGTQGAVDISVSDGTHTVKIISVPASATPVANQGINLLIPILVTLSDSLTTIASVQVIVVSATANNGTVRVVFNGSN